MLNRYIKRTRLQLVRLLVILRWSQKLPQIQQSELLVQSLAQQDDHYRFMADKLYELHFSLKAAKCASLLINPRILAQYDSQSTYL